MSELNPSHLDDFTLLRYTAGDLNDIERRQAARHMEACAVCARVLGEIAELDEQLQVLIRQTDTREVLEALELAGDDPFRIRPTPERATARRRIPVERLAEIASGASGSSGPLSDRLLEAATKSSDELKRLLADLFLAESTDRLALFYALQGAGRRIGEGPLRMLRFSEEALSLLRGEASSKGAEEEEAELVVPLLALRAQAHTLAGKACLWTGDFEVARTHFELAYRSFGRSTADEVSLAGVELHESQRRSFTGNATEGLLLARRAVATFEALGLEDDGARAQSVVGLALQFLGRYEEAVEVLRRAMAIFERKALWIDYEAAVNTRGTALSKLGRLDEARRDYARALRRISRDKNDPRLAYIRDGLAGLLFSAGRFREAALSFAQSTRMFENGGSVANSLTASLFEIESWARTGDRSRAQHRLEIFRNRVARLGVLDPSVSKEIEEALSGANPNLERIAELRERASGLMRERFGASA